MRWPIFPCLKLPQITHPLTRWSSPWLLPSCGNYEYGRYKYPCAGFWGYKSSTHLNNKSVAPSFLLLNSLKYITIFSGVGTWVGRFPLFFFSSSWQTQRNPKNFQSAFPHRDILLSRPDFQPPFKSPVSLDLCFSLVHQLGLLTVPPPYGLSETFCPLHQYWPL